MLVIGPTVAQELFGGGDPVGANVEIDNTSFEIVGVTASKGSNGSTDLDDIAIAPLSTVQELLTGYGDIDQILVQANSADSLSAAQTEATDILNAADPPSAGSDESSNFEVVNQSSILQTSDSSQQGLHHAAGRGRGDFATGRRDRRDEHHARVGHRADP